MSLSPNKLTQHSDAAALRHLRKLREPFAAINSKVVQGIMRRCGLLDSGGQSIEFSSGDGQLREWLPAELANKLIQAEPSAARFTELCRRSPDHVAKGRAVQASAYELPANDHSFDAVLGLCAYDALEEPAKARDEIKRVLKPGGWFIHFLDRSAQLESLFKQMQLAGELPLPNFLASDVVALNVEANRAATLPVTDLLDDLVVARRDELTELVAMFVETNHPLADDLVPYLKLFEPDDFDSSAAVQAYLTWLADDERLLGLNRALLAIYLALNETPQASESSDATIQTSSPEPRTARVLPFTVTFFATWKYMRGQLESHFSQEHGFEVDISGIVAARQTQPREETTGQQVKYVARCVGKTFRFAAIPAALQGTAVEALDESEPDLEDWREPNDDELVAESGMFVFTARKHLR